ncbi:hypothetical protein BCR35DRAFT_302448 [Leucosporidium creatinivorum]|uniref:Cytochrome b mRNA-processing protein 4 n=1 Tax=Leucosporidium creatinivorum TaxID=106004 RepID=A0A1Y2FRV4_9BASI|nr:hypothetical protein BCR35DRAFT_302448 [Leucosporidium creatinivorum]
MAGRIPIGSALLFTGAVTGLGYGIMYLTTPTDQQFYDSLAPDLKRKVDENRALQRRGMEQREALERIKKSAELDKPVWAAEEGKKV